MTQNMIFMADSTEAYWVLRDMNMTEKVKLRFNHIPEKECLQYFTNLWINKNEEQAGISKIADINYLVDTRTSIDIF